MEYMKITPVKPITIFKIFILLEGISLKMIYKLPTNI